MSDVRELVSRQLHLPPQFVRVDECDSAANNEVSKLDKNSSSTANQDFALSKPSDAASSFNGSRRVIILTTFDWLTAVQSDARLSSTSGDGAIGDFDRISDADRTRFLAPSTESVPAPWIRVGVVVELKKEKEKVTADVDQDSGKERCVNPPQRRYSALHDQNGKCIEPKFLNLAAFVSNSIYENSWKSLSSGGNGLNSQSRKSQPRHQKQTHRDAILASWDALYKVSPSSWVDDIKEDHSDFNKTTSLQTTSSHPNVSSCFCVLDSPEAIFLLQPYAPHSLFHVMTYTPAAMADNYAKSLFLAYQLLKAIDFCHARGIFVGDLRLSEVKVDEKLWIKVFPRAVGESFLAVEDEDDENDQENNSSQVSAPSSDPLRELSDDWVHGRLSNFDYLMALNKLAGRVLGDPNNHPILPWVVDFSTPDSYRDLSKSKYRLNKGDHQLDLMFESQQTQIPVSNVDIGGSSCVSASQDFPRTPHHISDMLSDITYYVYCARRVDKSTLCAHVRSHWVPHEYPMSMRRMFFWTPDECIPEFFTDASIFSSIHEDLPDLEIPSWAKSPQDFVNKHRRILEGHYVSKNLHRWIDLTFGFMLSGPAAVANKNVCLQLVDGHEVFAAHGVVQLFTHPHPQKLVDSLSSKRPSYLESMALSDFEGGDDISFGSGKNNSLNGSSIVESHASNPLLEDGVEEAPFDKKSLKSPKEGTLRKQKLANQKIILPNDFNPLARLEAVEALHQFVTKNLHEVESSSKDPKAKADAQVESHQAFVARKTKRDMTVFAVLIAEMFLAKRLRFQIGDFHRTLEERMTVAKSVCEERFHDIPRPFRLVLKMMLGLAAKEDEDYFGLPITPDILLHPLVDVIPFPPVFDSLYSFLSKISALTDRVRQHERKIDTNNIDRTVSRVAIESISRLKIEECTKALPHLMPKLSSECLEIVLPYLKDLLEDPFTAVATAWHFFSVIAGCFGPEKTIKHFLASMIKIFQQDDKVTTAKHMKLYHRTFVLQLMVGFGLNTFLNSFSTLMVEATAGFKNFVDEDFLEKVEAPSVDGFQEFSDKEIDYDPANDSRCNLRISDGDSASYDGNAGGNSDPEHRFERSGGAESASLTSVSDVFDAGRMGPILEADLASLEGEMSEAIDSEDEDLRKGRNDSLTIVENNPIGSSSDAEDEGSYESRDEVSQLGSSVHSISRLIHFKGETKRNKQKVSDASSVNLSDEFQQHPPSGENPKLYLDGPQLGDVPPPQGRSSSSHKSDAGRSSALSSDPCNIADVSCETLKWLASRLGPVLTTKYLSGNLLKMLSLCYLGIEQLQPTPAFSEGEEGSLGNAVAGNGNRSLNYAVKGDANARHVLDAISTIAIHYGEQIILLHYFPYLSDLISMSAKKRRLHVRAEAGLVSSMVLLRHCLPLLGDQTLMDYLPDVVFKDILEKLIALISNPKIGFPSGSLSRSVICYKIIDVMVMVSLRIGFEMTRKMMTTLLKRFFACFDTVHSTEDVEAAADLTFPRTPSIEASMYVEIKKDSLTQELVEGTPFRLEIQSPTIPSSSSPTERIRTKHTRSSSLYSLSALAMETGGGEEEDAGAKKEETFTPSSGADIDSPSEDEERNKAELKQVFTSALAHSVYVPFCKLAGNIHLDQTLSNKNLIHALVAKVEVLLQSASGSEISSVGGVNLEGRSGQAGSLSHSTVTGNFGKDVAVSGNRINIAGDESAAAYTTSAPSPSASQLLSPSRISLSPDLEARALIDLSTVDLNQLKSLEMQNNTRHLKGNWLQYWEHEQGLSPQDANTFDFKGIRLQSFVGHTGAVRALSVLDNENSFLSASKDKTVKLWSIRNFGDGLGRTHPRGTLLHKKSAFSVLFLNSTRHVASCDSTIYLWDPFMGAQVRHFDATKIAPVSVLAAVPAPSTTLIAATTENHNTLKLLDCRQSEVSLSSELRLTPSSGAGLIRCVSVSPDGNWVACGFSSGILCVVDLRTGMIIGMWKAHEGEIYKVETFNASTVVTASFDQTIQVWDVIAKKKISQLRGHLEPAHCLGFFKSAVISATTANKVGVHSNVTPEASFAVSKLHTDVFKGVLTTMSVLSLNRLLLFGADNGSIKLCC